MKYELELPLPPSINRLYVYNKYTRQKVYKREGRDYLDTATLLVKAYVNKKRLQPKGEYFYLDCYFYLPRTNADSHNYKKLIMDVLEHGELVVNDKFIMDRTMAIEIDRENPHVILRWE